MSIFRTILLILVIASMLILVFAAIGGASAGEANVLPVLFSALVGGFLAMEIIMLFGRVENIDKTLQDVADVLEELLEEQRKTNNVFVRAAERQKSRLNRE